MFFISFLLAFLRHLIIKLVLFLTLSQNKDRNAKTYKEILINLHIIAWSIVVRD